MYLCSVIKNKDTTVWKQQATNRRQYKRQQWRRKTLNRLNVKLYTCKGGLNSTEHYNRACKANKRNATTKNGFSSTPLISGYKVASSYLIPTINNKGMKQRRKKQRFCSVPQKRCPTARSGYLFSCLITCLHGYKIGHEKQINKVLFPVRRYITFW